MTELTEPHRRYWFRAKRYGWGWGLPATWEGWVVFGGYLATIGLAVVLLEEEQVILVLVPASAALVAICAWKGEPARWRWGSR